MREEMEESTEGEEKNKNLGNLGRKPKNWPHPSERKKKRERCTCVE